MEGKVSSETNKKLELLKQLNLVAAAKGKVGGSGLVA